MRNTKNYTKNVKISGGTWRGISLNKSEKWLFHSYSFICSHELKLKTMFSMKCFHIYGIRILINQDVRAFECPHPYRNFTVRYSINPGKSLFNINNTSKYPPVITVNKNDITQLVPSKRKGLICIQNSTTNFSYFINLCLSYISGKTINSLTTVQITWKIEY